MPSIAFSLVLLVLTNFLIEPTAYALQNLELDDITSLQQEFPSIIRKIKVIVNQLRCPKGWTHFGGSCYYLSKIPSLPTETNHTCNQLHSNHSNLIQIRNILELFYAAHVLTKNNLSALMINIDPNLLKGKTSIENLMSDQDQWQRMRDKFREERVKRNELREKILDEFNSAGLRISIHSKKYKNQTKINSIFSTNTIAVDEFERMENIEGICDRIEWNVKNNDSTIYKLTTSLISDKIICSFNNIEADIKYRYICEYVLDFCFANIACGKHGRCVNTLSGFKCSCSFLYDGLLCEKISKQGQQIILGVILILILYVLSTKPIQWILVVCIKGCTKFYLYRPRVRKQRKQNKENKIQHGTQKLVSRPRRDENHEEAQEQHITNQCRPTIVQEIKEFISPRNTVPLKKPDKRNLIRLFWVSGLSILFLTLLLSITIITHFTLFKYDVANETRSDSLIIHIIQSVVKCGSIRNYAMKYFVFCPIALALILYFSWLIKREKRCLNLCDGRPGLIAPIEPFRTENRFTTATVFGLLAFEILKVFNEFLFSTRDPLNHGILVELFEKLGLFILIGLQYYPILASLQLRNFVARFVVCLYVLADIIYTIIEEGLCMGILPLSRYDSGLEAAKLRMENGTWFTIYGLIKNIPHFILLSYISAELCVRFGYDSIYVPCKKKQSIWSSPVAQPDESAFAKYYVTKLFRRNIRSYQRAYAADVNIDELDDFEHEAELQRKANQSRVKKFFDWIYHWDDDFRFTTIATCTYTVAIIFLYYLACTFVFLYASKTTDHMSFIAYYIEMIFNIKFKGFFSLNSEIIISVVISVVIIAHQLYIGMNNYKKHKLQLFKGIYQDIPSAANLKSNTIVSKSVFYFGFLVGHMACGFIILFHFIFFILIAIRILSLQIPYFQLILAVTVPILVVYLLIMTITLLFGKSLLIQTMKGEFNSINRKTYAIFVYFSFFIDCFLGIASCILRLIKAMLVNVIYMSRLDYSFLGRPLEKWDFGFATYVSYLHIEVAYTNPIMLAFCYSLYEDIVRRRPKQYYDEECCTVPGELNDDEMVIELKPWGTKNVNESLSKTKKVYAQKTALSIKDDNNSINTDDNDEDLSIKAMKSSNSSVVSKKGSQKFEKQIDTDIEEEEEEKQLPSPYVSTTYSTISHMVNPQTVHELPAILRQKRARFRWFLAYTILNNYYLFDLRKQVQSRLALLRVERSNLIDDYPQSPAERYAAIRSFMLYDTTAQQSDTSRSAVVSQVPSTLSQQLRTQLKSGISPKSHPQKK